MPTIANSADLAHMHLLLNHVPTIGTILALGLLLIGLVRGNEAIQKVGFEVVFLIALATLPVYVSGNAAADVLARLPGVVAETIAAHNDAALESLILMQIGGACAWFALWRVRRTGRVTRGLTWTVLVLVVLAIAATSLAANIGGAIRHPEIQGGQYEGLVGSAPGGFTVVSAAGIQSYWKGHAYTWPFAETLHFIGMSLMFGVLMLVNLRLLGWLRGMSFASVHRLLPLGLCGFAINFATGMFFFIAQPEQYITNRVFHWKIVLLMLMGVTYLVLTVYDEAWELSASGEALLTGKVLAISALVASIGVMYCGRMLPFIGNSF